MTEKELEKRKLIRRSLIKNGLKDLLRCAKQGQKTCAEMYYFRLSGALDYMELAGDIAGDTRERIRRLAYAIQRKYHIY